MNEVELAKAWFDGWVDRDVPRLCRMYQKGCIVQAGQYRVKGLSPVYEWLATEFDWAPRRSIELVSAMGSNNRAMIEWNEMSGTEESGEPTWHCSVFTLDNDKIVRQHLYSFQHARDDYIGEFSPYIVFYTGPQMLIPEEFSDRYW